MCCVCMLIYVVAQLSSYIISFMYYACDEYLFNANVEVLRYLWLQLLIIYIQMVDKTRFERLRIHSKTGRKSS